MCVIIDTVLQVYEELMRLCVMLQDLELTDHEYALLTAICIMQPSTFNSPCVFLPSRLPVPWSDLMQPRRLIV